MAGTRTLMNYPLYFFFFSVIVLWLSAKFGALLRRRRPLKDDLREDFGRWPTYPVPAIIRTPLRAALMAARPIAAEIAGCLCCRRNPQRRPGFLALVIAATDHFCRCPKS